MKMYSEEEVLAAISATEKRMNEITDDCTDIPLVADKFREILGVSDKLDAIIAKPGDSVRLVAEPGKIHQIAGIGARTHTRHRSTHTLSAASGCFVWANWVDSGTCPEPRRHCEVYRDERWHPVKRVDY